MNNNSNSNNDNTNKGPLPTTFNKLTYLGAGIGIGLVIYPFVKKGLEFAKPMMGDMFNQFLGKAEGIFEDSSDIISKAKADFKRKKSSAPSVMNPNAHEHTEDCDH